jgi:hypothetical protein
MLSQKTLELIKQINLKKIRKSDQKTAQFSIRGIRTPDLESLDDLNFENSSERLL